MGHGVGASAKRRELEEPCYTLSEAVDHAADCQVCLLLDHRAFLHPSWTCIHPCNASQLDGMVPFHQADTLDVSKCQQHCCEFLNMCNTLASSLSAESVLLAWFKAFSHISWEPLYIVPFCAYERTGFLCFALSPVLLRIWKRMVLVKWRIIPHIFIMFCLLYRCCLAYDQSRFDRLIILFLSLCVYLIVLLIASAVLSWALS